MSSGLPQSRPRADVPPETGFVHFEVDNYRHRKDVLMINRRTLGWLALVTFALLLGSVAIGESRDVLWILDDIVFFGFLTCLLLLLVLSVMVLARSALRRRSAHSTSAR